MYYVEWSQSPGLHGKTHSVLPSLLQAGAEKGPQLDAIDIDRPCTTDRYTLENTDKNIVTERTRQVIEIPEVNHWFDQ